MTPELITEATVESLHLRAAEMFVSCAVEAIETRGTFRVALSGGTTPRGVYEHLAADEPLRSRVRWNAVRFFWGDERHVDPDHPDSNFRMARTAMLAPLGIADEHIFRIRGELADAEAAALDYEQRIRDDFGGGGTAIPRLDLVLLGMGADGHTASLFPYSDALRERQRLVVPNHVPQLDTERITMTVPIINAGREILFLVAGRDKAPALRDVLLGPFEPERLPSQFVKPAGGRVRWLVDRAASSGLAGG